MSAEGNHSPVSTVTSIHGLERGSCLKLVMLVLLIIVSSYSLIRIAVDLAWKFHVWRSALCKRIFNGSNLSMV
jgi:hypothetical protein